MITFQSIFNSKIHRHDFFIFLKLFLTSIHQNDMKISKKNNLKQINKFQIFSKAFLKRKNKQDLIGPS
jgi:hypothetical protein